MHRSRSVLTVGVALQAALVVALLPACGSASPSAAPTVSAGGSGTASAAVSSSGAASSSATPTVRGTAAAPPTAAPPSTRPVAAPSGSSHCLTGTVDILYPGSDNPLRSICVHAGTRIRITLRVEPGAPWRPVVTSAPQSVAVVSDTVAAGSVDASVQALAPGSAVLSAETRPSPDPSGPMTKRWQLDVTVVA
jgi:hypothetical protein